jgi:hypothetical protein
MEALLSFVPEASMWQRQVLCEPDLNVICATEEQVHEWIATDMAEARVLSQMTVNGESWALVMTSWSEPMWLPETSLERTESADLVVVIEATECFGNRAVVEWVQVEPDGDADWLQVEAAAEYVLVRRWDEAMQRARGPVMRASAFDVIRRAPLERPARPAQDRAAGLETPTTRPSISSVPVALPDEAAAPGVLGRFLKSAISSDVSAPAARMIPDKLAAMSVALPTTLPAMSTVSDMLSDVGIDRSAAGMVAAAPSEPSVRSAASGARDPEQAILVSRQVSEALAGPDVRPPTHVEPRAAPGQDAAGTRAQEASRVDIASDPTGNAPEPDLVARRPATMVAPSARPVTIREPSSGSEPGSADVSDSVSGQWAQRTQPAQSTPNAAVPRVSARASTGEAPAASTEPDPERPAGTPRAPGQIGGVTGASRDTPAPSAVAETPVTTVHSSSRSRVSGELTPGVHHESEIPSSSPAGSRASGTARPPAASTAMTADRASHRGARPTDDARPAHPRSSPDLGHEPAAVDMSAIDVSAGPVSEPSRTQVPSPTELTRSDYAPPSSSFERGRVDRGHGAQDSHGLAQEPVASRVAKAPLPSSLAADEIVIRHAASQSSRHQPAPEQKPAAPATPQQVTAVPPRPGAGEDRTLPAPRAVPAQRPAAGVSPEAFAATQPRRPADGRPVGAQPLTREATATEPLVRVRATATAAPVIHIAPAAERRERGRDALMSPTLRVIRNLSLGPVVVEVGEPETSSRESPRKAEPGSLLASIPSPMLRGFS